MLISLLLLNCLLWFGVGMKLNMYNTDQILDIDNFQVNCLHYYIRNRADIMEKIEYCLGPIEDNNNYSLNDIHGRSLTFDQLHQLNVTTDELLLWSSTIDLAEKYQYYLNHENNSFLKNEVFFNCTKPWFGSRCQYSFASSRASSFDALITRAYTDRYQYEYPYSINNLTCYTHLTCNRSGSNICLDWREVCNGRIDCINEAVDESLCFQLEINECDESEYRCHNGQCIPKEFLQGEFPECLDISDVWDTPPNIHLTPYLFTVEEHWCRLNYKQWFCIGGSCKASFDPCDNIQHILLLQSINIPENSSNKCWMIMICLTKILDKINKPTCKQFLNSFNLSNLLENCDDIIQFPKDPVFSGHVRFLYEMKKISHWDSDLVLVPDYICYDDRLCDFIIPTYHYGDYSCRHRQQFDFHLNMKYETWTSFMDLIEAYFQKCSINYNNNTHYPSLYCCKNSSKCISKHRILDNISDCYLNDDEEQYELSCSINDVLRSKCAYDNRCYSFVILQQLCEGSHLRTFDKLEFRNFCNRHIQMFPLIINGINHTDETDCEHWPCNNFYTRCDGFWSCSNGEDEENCTTNQICPTHSLPCVNPSDSTVTCLSANQVNDGKIDCLGSIDERQYCRNILHIDAYQSNFRCWDDDTCIGLEDFCDETQHCPDADDEKFCQNYDLYGVCSSMDLFNLTDVENAICITISIKEISFTLKTLSTYPRIDNRTNEQVVRRTQQQQHNIPRLVTNELDNLGRLWYCNHGLYVRYWLGNNQSTHKCFCSPSYYGDRCQYQNQRVSLTVQIRVMNTTTLYAAYITLIDDDDYRQKIISYQQYSISTSSSCIHTFNGYLTYETRPKNKSTNYAIRINIYDRTSRTYVASWHYTIPHLFLPVNRMAVVLYVPTDQVLSVSSSCSLKCRNGTCMKYMNKDKSYCQCDVGWSGVECNIPIRCNDCSSDSICIGMIYNRPICVCPLNKGGSRCLLTFSCSGYGCLNNGTCVIVDDHIHDLGFTCICSREFRGRSCEKAANIITISLQNIQISSIALIYTFYFSRDDDNKDVTIVSTIAAHKLTIFQRIISVITPNAFQIVFVKINNYYYLAFVQEEQSTNISTSIDSSRQCTSIHNLLTIEQQNWPQVRRIKSYHKICKTHLDTLCFIDDSYACLCTLEHHANCFQFRDTPPKCRDQSYCKNQGICLQDSVECPITFMCNCIDCYFGDRCQYYAKGIGLTLDDILRYEIRPNVLLSQQSTIIKWSCGLTMIIFVCGLLNGVLSLLTFSTKQARDNGCGLYLLASSITSLLTVSIFTGKLWFLLLTQINPSVSQSVLRVGCISFEFLLKICLYLDNWLNACVALERVMTVYKGINFNKMSSKRFARWIIFLLPFLIAISIIHEPLYRDLFDDKDEHRFWCVFYYSSSIQTFNTFIICVHFISPFFANLFSAFFIILVGTRRRATAQERLTYNQHLYNQFKEQKNLIISPIILVILSIPGLIIAIYSDCVKVSYNTWLYLSGYLISFLPSTSIFIVFVIPSEHYKKQFKEAIQCRRRR